MSIPSRASILAFAALLAGRHRGACADGTMPLATTAAAASSGSAGGCPGAWTAGGAYGEGDAVAVDGVVYRCKPWPMGTHCVQAGYKPGTTEGGAGDEVHPERHQDSTEFWRLAWDVAGSCAGDGPALVVSATTCVGNADCDKEKREFCRRPAGQCGGEGTCEAKAEVCIEIYQPVCGCDGATYANDCKAAEAGASVQSEGECAGTDGAGGPGVAAPAVPGATSACATDEDCGAGRFCERPTGQCGAAAEGKCTATPPVCTMELNEVCGCDDVTFGNPCAAQAAGVSIKSMGACDKPAAGGDAGAGTAAAACTNDADCGADAFCLQAEGQCDGPGTCELKPQEPMACTAEYDPVCGCDGKDYSNPCGASMATTIASRGECPPAAKPDKPPPVDGDVGVAAMPGSSYCTYAPDVACYPGRGWPACCGTDAVCPPEPPACEGAAPAPETAVPETLPETVATTAEEAEANATAVDPADAEADAVQDKATDADPDADPDTTSASRRAAPLPLVAAALALALGLVR